MKRFLNVEKEYVFHYFKVKRLVNSEHLEIVDIKGTDYVHLHPKITRFFRLGKVITLVSNKVGKQAVLAFTGRKHWRYRPKKLFNEIIIGWSRIKQVVKRDEDWRFLSYSAFFGRRRIRYSSHRQHSCPKRLSRNPFHHKNSRPKSRQRTFLAKPCIPKLKP